MYLERGTENVRIPTSVALVAFVVSSNVDFDFVVSREFIYFCNFTNPFILDFYLPCYFLFPVVKDTIIYPDYECRSSFEFKWHLKVQVFIEYIISGFVIRNLVLFCFRGREDDISVVNWYYSSCINVIFRISTSFCLLGSFELLVFVLTFAIFTLIGRL